MTSQVQQDRRAGEQRRAPTPPTARGLTALVTAIRVALGERTNWADTAALVASALERHLPSPSILTAGQRTGDRETYKSEVLHSEPDGSFSIVALVWRPGQVTPIHDHVTCACSESSRASSGRSCSSSTNRVAVSSRRATT